MFKTLINAWNVKDIRTKMLYTLLLVVIYRFGSFIPVPGVDASKIAAAADTYSILSFLNLLSGGALHHRQHNHSASNHCYPISGEDGQGGRWP